MSTGVDGVCRSCAPQQRPFGERRNWGDAMFEPRSAMVYNARDSQTPILPGPFE
jgi:hypothetical protein